MMTPIIGRLTLTDGMRRPVSGRYAGDVEAKLLTFGAILCAGSTSDARALFASIDPEKMLPLFRFPYAAAMAHPVLVGRCSDLSEKGHFTTRLVAAAGGDQHKQIKLLINLSRGGPAAVVPSLRE